MKTTIFSARRISRVRSLAVEAGRVRDEVTRGWSKSNVDPVSVVAAFGVLHVKPAYVLRAYQFVAGGNGNGIVWAMPADAPFPDPADCPHFSGRFLEPPRPPVALDDFMDAVDGDGSPWSYLCASVLKRELYEFGAMWHGCQWGTHTILGTSPFAPAGVHGSQPAQCVAEIERWHWERPLPSQWRPRVSHGSHGGAMVRFLTFSALGEQKLILHEDHFRLDSYRCSSDEKVIGRAAGGFCF